MRIVVALGGNALLRRGEPPEANLQQARVVEVGAGLAELAREHELVITHGNGPQVGLLALESENYRAISPYPLDVLGAESQGMIGYLLVNALSNHIAPSAVTAVLTRVEVSSEDPAFNTPTKPIGAVYDRAEAHRLATERGWDVAVDGEGWRRVVASPEPKRILELEVIRALVTSGITVVAAGGGGIPVSGSPPRLLGIEAVIDKDLTASLLASRLDAELLVILTDVPGVALGWGTPGEAYIARASTEAMRGYAFATGSMGPKVEACLRFAEETGAPAVIGHVEDLAAVVSGDSGTVIERGRAGIELRRAA